jgi:nitrite reductase (NADH) small subunit
MNTLTGRWLRITDLRNLPLREGRAVTIGGNEIAVFNLGDSILAIENRCPHRRGPLADGIVSGSAVVCPLHAWKIDLATGSVLNQPAGAGCVRTYHTRLVDGIVQLWLPSQSTGQFAATSFCPDADAHHSPAHP